MSFNSDTLIGLIDGDREQLEACIQQLWPFFIMTRTLLRTADNEAFGFEITAKDEISRAQLNFLEIWLQGSLEYFDPFLKLWQES